MVVLHGAVGCICALSGLGWGARPRGTGPRDRDAVLEDELPDPGGHPGRLLGDVWIRVGSAVAEGVDEQVDEAINGELDADGGKLIADP